MPRETEIQSEIPPPLEWIVDRLRKAYEAEFFGEITVTIKEGMPVHARVVESHQAPPAARPLKPAKVPPVKK